MCYTSYGDSKQKINRKILKKLINCKIKVNKN